jgi:UDPglucose--hexose-1-phosphate uridylyltransferase
MKSSVIDYLISHAEKNLYFDSSKTIDFIDKIEKHFGVEKDNEPISSIQHAVELIRFDLKNLIEIEQDRMIDMLFSWLTEPQEMINQRFWLYHRQSSIKATHYLFELGKSNRYIQSDKIAKNRRYDTQDIIVTINLSKEEKDNKQIAKALKEKPETFPKCVLCYENVGYLGKNNQAPRGTLRVAELVLENQPWFMQYSPYPYFEEHAIFIDQIHRPMQVDQTTIAQLFQIIELFPHYFVGSNASLPIIGGSILSHAHFQGGKNIMFPMMKALPIKSWNLPQMPHLIVESIDWPATVLRVRGKSKEEMIRFAHQTMLFWESYQNQALGIYSQTKEGLHHAIAPILYQKDEQWILHIVFRSNLTNDVYPEGIYHAHPEYHHIKKEGIGLIEAMGMFILPGRLAPLMDQFIESKQMDDLYQITKNYPVHSDWLIQTFSDYDFSQSKENKKLTFINALKQVCLSILDNIAIFKDTKEGKIHEKDFFEGLLKDIK